MNSIMISRRAVIGGLAVSAAAAATGSLVLPRAQADVLAGPSGDGLRSGFRVGFRTRLAVLEADAGLPQSPVDDRFRNWAVARVRRLERRRGIKPEEQHDQPWRTWMSARLNPLEAFLPAPLRFPFYTHIPLDVAGPDYGPFLRQRIAAGECNGIFLYGGPSTPLAPNATLDSITGSGPPVPILMSPKNVSDPVTLKAWMDYWAARPEWIPYIRVAYWQEPQGDFGGAGQPPVSQWHQGVVTLADAADRVGIASAAHVETWHLDPSQPHGGIPRLLEFLQPVIHRLGAGLSWSVFVFNQKPEGGPDCIRRMNEFMASYFPYSTYGVAAYGDSVPPSTPPDDFLRVVRAERLGSMFADLDVSRARYGGYYALAAPENPAWSFWDGLSAAETAVALAKLTDRGRTKVLSGRDGLVHLEAERAAG